jgi:hypothetical protein
MPSERIGGNQDADWIRRCFVPTALPIHKVGAADIIALALDHCIQAERSACPARQQELYRVAEIYLAVATIGLTEPTVGKVDCLAQPDTRQLADAIK